MKYEKPKFLTSCTLADLQAQRNTDAPSSEGVPPFLYLMSPNAYEGTSSNGEESDEQI